MKILSQSEEFTLANSGRLSEVKGKLFLKEYLDTTAMEVSISTLEPGTKTPFLHRHRQNEELYVILSGEGLMELNDERFSIKEGSLVRVAPSVARGMINTGSTQLLFICIQAKDHSLEGYTLRDGMKVDRE